MTGTKGAVTRVGVTCDTPIRGVSRHVTSSRSVTQTADVSCHVCHVNLGASATPLKAKQHRHETVTASESVTSCHARHGARDRDKSHHTRVS
jgi:hypothetical protein